MPAPPDGHGLAGMVEQLGEALDLLALNAREKQMLRPAITLTHDIIKLLGNVRSKLVNWINRTFGSEAFFISK